jgi:RNA polymerase sigma-70 factor (ECF subfamily)
VIVTGLCLGTIFQKTRQIVAPSCSSSVEEQLMEAPSGNSLIQGLAQGQDEAFAALYDQLGQALFRVACVLLGSRQDAEDAVQEVFVGLMRSRRSLPQVEDLRAYVFASLRFAVQRIATARNKERRAPAQDLGELAAPEAPALDLEQEVRLERALRALPAEQRELIALKVDAGLTFAEIASCLGISPNTAASRYRYALEKLRAAFED